MLDVKFKESKNNKMYTKREFLEVIEK